MKAKKSKPKVCPRCKSAKVVPIVYGYPVDPEAIRQAERGELVFGGCVLSGRDPRWACIDCRHEWGRTAAVAGAAAVFLRPDR